MKKFIEWIKSPKSDFALFILLLILANIVGHNSFVRLDLTEPKAYTISKASKQIVKNLEEPLSVKVFFDEKLPPPYNTYSQYLKDLLDEFKGAGGKNFSVSYFDMTKTENQDMASEFGLRRLQIQEVNETEVGFKQVYMGMALSYGNSVEVLDAITTTDGLEYKITSTISNMINKVDSLSGLGKENRIKLTLYMTSALKNLRISGMDQVEAYVSQIYKEVNKKNLDRIDFEVVSPEASEVQSLYELYGLQTISYNVSEKEQRPAIFGLTISMGDKFRVLPLAIERGFFGYGISGLEELETNMNDGIKSLLSKTTQVGYVIGHMEHSLTDQNDSRVYASIIENANYELVEVDLYSEDVPASMNTIIINGPKQNFSDEELYRVDQFLMRGGNVLFFVDTVYSQGGSNAFQQQFYPMNLNISRLLNAYGVEAKSEIIQDVNSHYVSDQNYGKVNYYYVPVVQKNNLAKHPITNNLGYVYMLRNGVIDASEAQKNKDLKTTILVRSSDKSWTETEDVQKFSIFKDPPSDLQSYDMAVLLEGKFKSAFDEAVAHVLYDDEGNIVEVDTANDNLTTDNFLRESRLPGKVFVIGSSQITTVQLMDENSTSPVAMFLVNVVDYVNGNEDLCTMRTKNVGLRTLEIGSPALAQLLKYFCIYGLVILVVISGFVALRMRAKHRVAIRKRYNPDDAREIKKEKKTEEKSEKEGE